jgi:hypothetical protein
MKPQSPRIDKSENEDSAHSLCSDSTSPLSEREVHQCIDLKSYNFEEHCNGQLATGKIT